MPVRSAAHEYDAATMANPSSISFAFLSVLALASCTDRTEPTIVSSPHVESSNPGHSAPEAALEKGERPVARESAVPTQLAATDPAASALDPRYLAKDPSKLELTLERTACHGSCPVYTVTVRGDGTCAWHGEQDVGTLGDVSYAVAPAEVAKLVAQSEVLHFLDLDDAYRMDVKDAPSTILTLSIDGKKKRIVNLWVKWDEPTDDAGKKTLAIHEGLDALAQAIDRAAGSEGLVAGKEPRKTNPGVRSRQR